MNKTLTKFLLYIAAIAIVVAMVRLGYWQLSRADEKQAIQDYVVEQQSQKIDLAAEQITEENLYQQGFGVGELLLDAAILVDNQVFNGLVGYHVLAPFKAKGSQQLILVNVGWVSAGNSRAERPVITLPIGEIEVSGRLQKAHSQPPLWLEDYELIQNDIWQYLPLETYRAQTGFNVAPLILELDSELKEFDQYQRQWREYDNKWVNRHKAYALQWFTMAVVFILMCLMLEFRSRRKVG